MDCNSFAEIKDTTSYDVVMTEDYSKGAFSSQNFTGLNISDLETIEKYITKNKIVYPAIEGRIVVQNIIYAPEGNSAINLATSIILVVIMTLMQTFLSSV